MLKTGNVGGELLNWLAMPGATGAADHITSGRKMQSGHTYGVWRWS
jgi:hypothetical protein